MHIKIQSVDINPNKYIFVLPHMRLINHADDAVAVKTSGLSCVVNGILVFQFLFGCGRNDQNSLCGRPLLIVEDQFLKELI